MSEENKNEQLDTFLTEMGDAIREVKGTASLINARDMIGIVRGMSGGEDLTAELSEYDELNTELEDVINSLPDAGSGGGITEPDPRDEYQRVEYIESDRNQHIITDVIANNGTGIELVASYPVLEDRIAMGSRADANATRFYCPYPLSANSFYFGYNTGTTKSTGAEANTIYRSTLNFLNSRSARVLEEETGLLEFDHALTGTLEQQTGAIAIFGYLRGDTGSIYSTRAFVFYNARISQGNDIIREYIPCYRKSDGVIGLYEKFTGQFLINEGTGTFIKGADIE